MCLVDINRSTLSCNHSWYHLIQACTPTTSLESCSKLAVEGWEIKCDFCPFCAGWPLSNAEFQLLGGRSLSTSTARHNSVSSSGSSTNESSWVGESTPRSMSWSTEDPLPKRRPSVTTVNTARKLSKTGGLKDHLHDISPVLVAREMNAHINELVDHYYEDSLEPSSITAQPEKRSASSRNDSLSNKPRQSIATVSELDEEAEQVGWKKSKRLSGMFRRGS